MSGSNRALYVVRRTVGEFWADLGERVVWTGIQAGLGVVTVEQLHVPVAYVPLVALALSAVKGLVASQLGSERTASTLPRSMDPALPEVVSMPWSPMRPVQPNPVRVTLPYGAGPDVAPEADPEMLETEEG